MSAVDEAIMKTKGTVTPKLNIRWVDTKSPPIRRAGDGFQAKPGSIYRYVFLNSKRPFKGRDCCDAHAPICESRGREAK